MSQLYFGLENFDTLSLVAIVFLFVNIQKIK